MSDTTRQIHVRRVEVEKTGQRGGRGWTLYRVYADEMDGSPITEVLKTFEAMNGIVEVRFKPYVKDGKVENYTIERVGKKSKPNGGSPDARIAELESRVATLERQMNGLISAIDTPLEVSP